MNCMICCVLLQFLIFFFIKLYIFLFFGVGSGFMCDDGEGFFSGLKVCWQVKEVSGLEEESLNLCMKNLGVIFMFGCQWL